MPTRRRGQGGRRRPESQACLALSWPEDSRAERGDAAQYPAGARKHERRGGGAPPPTARALTASGWPLAAAAARAAGTSGRSARAAAADGAEIGRASCGESVAL